MPQNMYPIYYIQVLKQLEKNESTKRELLQKLNLTHNKLYRSLDRLQLDGMVIKETKDGKEYFKLTEKGKQYLELLKKVVNA